MTATSWKNRIIEQSVEMPIEELLPNPKNWRKHPKKQREALGDVLSEVGLVQGVVFNRRTGRLVDGHLRVQLAKDHGRESLPATVVDLSEEEEALVLATLDPIGAMAETDKAAFHALIQELAQSESKIAQQLFSNEEIDPEILAPPDSRLDEKTKAACPSCGYEF